MIKAVLLDLDNTLLHNPDAHWVTAFRLQWDQHFAANYGVEKASRALRKALGCLNREPATYRTNADTIFEALASELPLTQAELSAAISSFYASRYRLLKEETRPIAYAADLAQALFDQDLLVAIATNPFFPEGATLERIGWAGLTDYISEFAFITHSENMHFAKPSPAYFAETIARVGVEPDEALLIGDSLINDIEPAKAIGIHTWQVNNADGLAPLVDHISEPNWRQRYLSRQLEPSMILPQFAGNIAALHGLLAEVKPHQWQERPDPHEWSILQILCHLWQTEDDVHRARLKAILDLDNPFIAARPPPGPNIPACHEDGYEVLRCFQRERMGTIKLLKQLTPTQWDRSARHSIFGLTTILEMAHFTAQHDRLHITQLCQTLGKCAE